jgi:hypothetical protein
VFLPVERGCLCAVVGLHRNNRKLPSKERQRISYFCRCRLLIITGRGYFIYVNDGCYDGGGGYCDNINSDGLRTHPVQQHQGVHSQELPHYPLLADRQTSLRYSLPHLVRQPQVVSKWNANPAVKRGWRLLGTLFQSSWAYQIFMFGLVFTMWGTFYFPCLWFYQYNNQHRSFEAAITKERAHKKKLREAEEAEEAAAGASE